MATVGIIANPASGKDIRRLVAYGTTFDNLQKVSIVRRAVLGMAEAGVDHLIYMPDYYNIVPRALDGLWKRHHIDMKIEEADIEMTATQIDSARAAEKMQKSGVDCIITLGGDGTNRMVAKGCKDIPLVPVSTGTNNVFPQMVEGTIAGLAAGAVARGLVEGDQAVMPTKRLEILKDGELVDIALVDAVVIKDAFVGSRAIWDEESIDKVVVTRGEPDCIGISSIAGNLKPVSIHDKEGLFLQIGPGPVTVNAPIAPGLIRPVEIKSYRTIDVGEEFPITSGFSVIALDGEREVESREEETYYIRLTYNGPRVVNVKEALGQAVLKGYAISHNIPD
ncbi:ATP-NAD kinase family protein [Syntrophomonas erecta]